jgi:TrmH family RNA methyltransferase
LWRSLLRSKGRRENGLFLVEGPRAVAELLDSEIALTALLHEEPPPGGISSLVEAFQDGEVACHGLPAREVHSLSGTETPQGIVAVAAIPRWSWQDLGSGDLLVLDGVQDPGNVGTLVRAAEALGMEGVALLPGTADPWSPKVTRAAVGSTLRMPILTSSWNTVVDAIRASGREVWAADADSGETLASRPARPAVALVLGNEGAGISEEILREADRRVAIPLEPPVESLNVGVAGALLMDRLRESRCDG